MSEKRLHFTRKIYAPDIVFDDFEGSLESKAIEWSNKLTDIESKIPVDTNKDNPLISKSELDARLEEVDLSIYDDTELRTLINNKVNKVSGKGLSTNDFTNEYKSKLTDLKNYDDTELRNLISEESLNRETNDELIKNSIQTTVNESIAKVVANAPEDFDTLKEMSDWISEHKDDASAMNTAILENKSAIETKLDIPIEILQADFDVLDEETRLTNNYYCTDTGRIYNKNVLYGEKKTITLSSQAEYDQMKTDGKIESDVDYVIEETEQNVNAVIGYVPIGVVFPYCATTPPVNYLICDGSLYEKTAYPELYAIIGNTFGGDDTTFAVPNLTDRFIQGGTNVGEYVEAGLPNITGELVSLNAGTSNFKSTEFVNGAFSAQTKWNALNGEGNMDSYGEVSFDASNSNAIYGASDTVQPPSVVLLYIIKCK